MDGKRLGQKEKIRIGMVCAMPEESASFYTEFGQVMCVYNVGSFCVEQFNYKDKEVYLINSGIGEISGALATQILILLFKVDFIFNLGLVGSLKPQYSCKQIVVADEIVHYDFTLSASDKDKAGKYPDQREDFIMKIPNLLIDRFLAVFPLERVRVASGDKFVDDSELKNYLVDRFDCDVCEMESAGIYRACKLHNIPLLMIKCISDNADEGANDSFNSIVKSSVDYYLSAIRVFIEQLDECRSK